MTDTFPTPEALAEEIGLNPAKIERTDVLTSRQHIFRTPTGATYQAEKPSRPDDVVTASRTVAAYSFWILGQSAPVVNYRVPLDALGEPEWEFVDDIAAPDAEEVSA